jgi:type VI secretion system protein ImpF
MARVSNKQAVVSSILDRLIDEEPDKLREALKSRHQQLTDLCLSVRRDLENLLNTRQPAIIWPKAWQELNTSLAAYGIPDFMGNSLETSEAQNKFCADLQRIIQRFEPRFKSVQVALLQNAATPDRTLRLRIEGLLYAEPVPEPIVFDSILEPETNSFSIVDNYNE